MTRKLSVKTDTFPIAGTFTISRGSRTEVHVVTAIITDGEHVGRGECVPTKRYGETIENVSEQIEGMRAIVEGGIDRAALRQAMPHGAARNAIDCALWDLEAKQANKPLIELPDWTYGPTKAVTTVYTISLGAPGDMREQAARESARPILKVKLGGAGDDERIKAVREGAPNCDLIIDANEAWDPDCFEKNLQACIEVGVKLIEQPLPAGDDDLLTSYPSPIPYCADESMHDLASLEPLAGKYQAINIKLDKAGGLTESLMIADAAEKAGFTIMVGCMVGSSLGTAPGFYLAQRASFVDLDASLLLGADRDPPLPINGSIVSVPPSALWG